MAQPPLQLIIGNYNTSSWSLRAWLVLRAARLAFVETRIPLRLPETPERIGRYSPSGKLPVLLAEGVPIWDSLAIAEFVAELEPDIWPLDPIARAEARAISAEVHSGFAELRRLMPMDVVGRFNAPGRLPRGLAADVQRVTTISEHCRARFATQGPFLFGAFSIADAMMAPIASRLSTHGVPLGGAFEDYVDSLMAWPDMVAWCEAAAAEQAERRATGSLAVASVTRPGRVLGAEPTELAAAPTADAKGTESEAAGPATDEAASILDSTPAEPAATLAATLAAEIAEPRTASAEKTAAPAAETPLPSAKPVEPAATAGDPEGDDAASGSGTPATSEAKDSEKKVGEPATIELPTDTARPSEQAQPPAAAEPKVAADPAIVPDPVPPVSPPRRRLFEPSPPGGSDTIDQRAASTRAGDGAASPASAEPEAPPARKLGWLRHRVPADHLDRIEQQALDGGAPERTDPEEAEADPAAPAKKTDTPLGPAPSRRPVQNPGQNPGAPAIKPIGGGIHRRR